MFFKKKYLKEASLFFLIFGINIVFKEFFRFFTRQDLIFEGTFLLFFLSLLLFSFSKKEYSFYVFNFLFFYLFLVFSSLMSSDTFYGFQKSFLGIIVPVFCFNLFLQKKWEAINLSKYLTLFVLIVTIVGIVYKLKAGFFRREVSFGLLGSITFGWLSGMAFLAVFLEDKKRIIDYILMVYFFTMVLWSGSKGPLLSMVVVMLLFSGKVFFKSFKQSSLILLFLIIMIFLVNIYSADIRSVRTIIEFIQDPGEYSSGQGQGSIGTRYNYIMDSVSLFAEAPFLGVGFGGWYSGISFGGHKYPHNIFFELLSEVGLFGLICFIFTLKNVLSRKNIFGVIGFYSIIALQVSGDFSYFRYAFFPVLIGLYINKNK